MPVSPSSSAQAARQAIADRLRDLRRDADLTAIQLAAAAGWDRTKVSKIEHATRGASSGDIVTWCRLCGAQDEAADLMEASRAADSMYMEWRRLHRTGLRRFQEARKPLYERTELMRFYCSNVVPGIFQTSTYATALLQAITDFQGTPNDVEAAVQARLDRSQVIYQAGHRFAVLIEEEVLRHRIGESDVMAGQLGHLLTMMSLPAVSLGVIPFAGPPREIWPLPTFTVFDDREVHIELLSASVTVTVPSEVGVYVKAHTRLAEMAVYGAAARALITAAIAALD
jgi:transcriptional regulator with XRE-family HTH domain